MSMPPSVLDRRSRKLVQAMESFRSQARACLATVIGRDAMAAAAFPNRPAYSLWTNEAAIATALSMTTWA